MIVMPPISHKLRGFFALFLSAMFAGFVADPALSQVQDGPRLVNDLRRIPPSALTEEAAAVLRSAPRSGRIFFCSAHGNAFVIQFDGRPALLTAMHGLVDLATGEPECDARSAARTTYMPNVSFYDDGDPEADSDFVLREITPVYPPVNLHPASHWDTLEGIDKWTQTIGTIFDRADRKVPFRHDYLIFFLDEDITTDILPDGEPRGFYRLSSRPALQDSEGDDLFLIGFSPEITDSRMQVFQGGCLYRIFAGFVDSTCESVQGVSGSVVGFVEDGEIAFTGLVIAGGKRQNEDSRSRPSGMPFSPPTSALNGRVVRSIEQAPRPDLLAFDIQFELSEAGCYSGALDNQWGPGSRDALARYAEASGLTIDGFEPTQAIFDLLRERRPQEQVC